MRLHGILCLCKKRASLDGSNRHLVDGISSLENVVARLEQCIEGERILCTVAL
jgi:hypothetical protein